MNPEDIGRRPARNFKELIVWQKAHQFVLEVYRYSDTFPRKEMYGLTSQLRRGAVSVAANIAEGFKKRSRREKAHYFNIAQGSLEECAYYLILAQDLNYGDSSLLQVKYNEVSKLLRAYNNSVINSCSFR